ncbi:hypothetical protein OB905_10170 [Halobacteria archaeon AArc-dxtr1]|nr:hypothetical protein [Halobacteria archaeon AArc-dxtr1]
MNGGSDMTLAFELEALKAVTSPEHVFEDARSWTTYVGVVSEKPTYVVTNFTRKNRVRQDFFSGPRGVEESLVGVKDQFDTERYVFIGTTDEDEAMADDLGWEFLHVDDAAEAADWTLASDATSDEPEPEPARDDWP